MGEIVLAACAEGQGILATDLRSGALVASFEEAGAQPAAFGLIGASSGYLFAAQSKKALWQAWAWGDKKPCYRASLPERMTAMAFSADASLCFGGAASGSIYAWQMGTGCLLRCWPAHFREVTQLLVSPDGSFLISASADANVHVYNLADIFIDHTPKPFHSWSGHSLSVTSLALLPGNGLQQVVASASLDRSVRLWDIGTGQPILSRSLSAPVNSISVGPTGSEILCACKNGELRLVSANNRESEGDGLLIGHTGSVSSCALNVDGSQAASCSEADRVRIWDMRTRQCIAQAHTSRNVQVNSVQIVQRWVEPQPLPAFQPFQRLLTKPEEVRPIPLGVSGRLESLKQALEPRASSQAFLDRMVWAQVSGAGALEGASQELELRRAAAEAGQARWAATAAELYGALVEAGLDEQASAAMPAPKPRAPEPAAAAAAAASPEAASAEALVAGPGAAEAAGQKKKKRRR